MENERNTTMFRMNRVGLVWILAWSIVFLLDLIIGFKDILCCKGLDIIDTEYYRLFTGLLLHINWFHVLANIVAMYFVCEFIGDKINSKILFLFTLVSGTITNTLFSIINSESYMVGGSPIIFALIGLIVIMQRKRKDLPRFKLGTWYGNWIVGYAILSNFPFFSKDYSTFLIHILGFCVGVICGLLIIKKRPI